MTEIEIKELAEVVHSELLVATYSKSLAACFVEQDSTSIGPTDLAVIRAALKHTAEAAQKLSAAIADRDGDEFDFKGYNATLAEAALRYVGASVG